MMPHPCPSTHAPGTAVPDLHWPIHAADADTIDFDGFLRLLKVASSTDHLDQVSASRALLQCCCHSHVRCAPSDV